MKRLPVYLTDSELKALLTTPYKTNHHHILIMRLMALCGLRVSEAVRIKAGDFTVQLDGIDLNIRSGKGDKDRVVVVPLDLWNSINLYITHNELNYDDVLFDITTSAVRQFVKRYGVLADIPKNVHPHMLRHTFAVLHLKAGVNIINISKALGHSSLSTTQIYLELSLEDRREDFTKHPVVV